MFKSARRQKKWLHHKHVDIILGTHNLHELSGMLKKYYKRRSAEYMG